MTTRMLEAPLTSNGYTLSTASDRLGWLKPSDPGWPVARLREQYQAQGYLWLKGLLEHREVLDFRRRYFEAFRSTGLLAPDTDPEAGIYAGEGEDKEAAHKVMVQVVRWPEYEAFCLSAPIVRFYEAFLEDKIYLHRRKLIRYTKPGDPHCTGSHYDLTYLRAGTDRLCSSWIPLGEVPVEMGGLVYLENSDPLGRQLEAEFQAITANLSPDERINAYAGQNKTGWFSENLPAVADRFRTRWLVADYEAGDMVVHSPYMIHASTVNQSRVGRMRLSTDIRFQRLSDAIDPRWTNHWSPEDQL